jgi:hypothetical protein
MPNQYVIEVEAITISSFILSLTLPQYYHIVFCPFSNLASDGKQPESKLALKPDEDVFLVQPLFWTHT